MWWHTTSQRWKDQSALNKLKVQWERQTHAEREKEEQGIVVAQGVSVSLLQPCFPGNKLTQKDNADSGVQFITPAGPRQSLLLAKDPDQHLWKSFIPHVYVSKPTTLNSLRLT